ncbi:uncharacterized protein LOC111240547 [Vigna radiata var. radiata]|uniref:Uncharacterized protein LOC111240547 n=1 Tax=Vigna radiata var. radiata TaxID=3916 RepID=A0A3Q0EI60_VIGRR|nr:uncharacterized protein LOC111240547 [Vigna radiata var. radiata]
MKKDAPMCEKLRGCHSFTPQNPIITPRLPLRLSDTPNGSPVKAVHSLSLKQTPIENSTDSSTVTAIDSCNSSISGNDNRFAAAIVPRSYAGDPQFSGELCVPYDDMA